MALRYDERDGPGLYDRRPMGTTVRVDIGPLPSAGGPEWIAEARPSSRTLVAAIPTRLSPAQAEMAVRTERWPVV